MQIPRFNFGKVKVFLILEKVRFFLKEFLSMRGCLRRHSGNEGGEWEAEYGGQTDLRMTVQVLFPGGAQVWVSWHQPRGIWLAILTKPKSSTQGRGDRKIPSVKTNKDCVWISESLEEGFFCLWPDPKLGFSPNVGFDQINHLKCQSARNLKWLKLILC